MFVLILLLPVHLKKKYASSLPQADVLIIKGDGDERVSIPGGRKHGLHSLRNTVL